MKVLSFEFRVLRSHIGSEEGAHAPSRVPTGALAGRSAACLPPITCPRCVPRGRGTLHARARALPRVWKLSEVQA